MKQSLIGVSDLLDRIALALVVIGALNWGSIGIFGFDLVASVSGGQDAILARIIYALVGIAGLWCISFFFKSNDVISDGHEMTGDIRTVDSEM